jgi:hypothetical protein
MGKLRLDINSTKLPDGTYGQVDIKFNGSIIESNRQLSNTVETLTYDVTIDNTSNTLGIALLNAQALDFNTDGIYLDEENETTKIQVSSLEYSIDDTNYITLLPQAATSYTIPSGPWSGNVITLTESVTQFTSYGVDYVLTFNSDGIVNTDYCSGLRGKVLPNGNFQDLVNGKTYDADGNEVGAP